MKFYRKKNKGIIFICIIILLFVNFGCSLYEKYENDISKGEAPIKKNLDDIDPKYHIHEKERINFILEMDDLLKAKEIDNFVSNVPIDQEYLLNLDSRSGPCPYCYEWPTVTVCAAEARFDGSNTHWWFGECTRSYFSSRGAQMCPWCSAIIETYGYHNCWIIHSDCWMGWYDICPMEQT